MNDRLTELYRSCRSKEGLASQDEYKSADVLLGTEVAKFAELIIRECAEVAQDFVTVENNKLVEHVRISPWHLQDKIKEHFGVEE